MEQSIGQQFLSSCGGYKKGFLGRSLAKVLGGSLGECCCILRPTLSKPKQEKAKQDFIVIIFISCIAFVVTCLSCIPSCI